MTAYKTIYDDIVARYGENAAFTFFNKHERDVRRRDVLKLIRRAMELNNSLPHVKASAQILRYTGMNTLFDGVSELTGTSPEDWVETVNDARMASDSFWISKSAEEQATYLVGKLYPETF